MPHPERGRPGSRGITAAVLFENRTRAESFGAVAEQYDRSRPSYPVEMIDLLVLDGPADVLDVGCGTGIAAVLLAERGCRVLGVEPDARMAQVSRSKGLAVEIAHFESWDDRERRFDLLTSGQAWHWIDPRCGAAKAGAVLRSGGRIGAFWNFGTLPDVLQAPLESVYAERAPGLDAHAISLGHRDERIEDTLAALRDSGLFDSLETHVFRWPRSYDTAQWIEQLVTHSDHQTLPERERGPLLDAVRDTIDAAGGWFEMVYEAHLAMARRR